MDEKQKVIIKWLENEVKGKKWDSYFASYKYKNITIYGAGDLGKLLIWALEGTEIVVNYVIDRRASEIVRIGNIEVLDLDVFLSKEIKTDAIVVTAITAYDDVLKTVAKSRINLPVMFLRDMVYEL